MVARHEPVAQVARVALGGVALTAEVVRLRRGGPVELGRGAERVAVELACALDRDRFAPHVLVTRGDGPLRELLERAAVPFTILEKDDDVMDELHRQLFTAILDDEWSEGIEPAIDITLAGRYYERFADHAVEVAQRVIFLATGEYATTPESDPEEPSPSSDTNIARIAVPTTIFIGSPWTTFRMARTTGSNNPASIITPK